MGAAAYSGEGWWYVASVRVGLDGRVAAVFDRVWPDGRFKRLGREPFGNAADAESRCRSAVRTKERKRGYVPARADDVPVGVATRMAGDTEPFGLLEMLFEARSERYVVLSDVEGMEEWFDAGVQYVGWDKGDAHFMEVADRFGTARTVLKSRVRRLETTEGALEAARVGAGV